MPDHSTRMPTVHPGGCDYRIRAFSGLQRSAGRTGHARRGAANANTAQTLQ